MLHRLLVCDWIGQITSSIHIRRGDAVVVEVIRADITDEEREEILRRASIIAGVLLRGIKEKGVKHTYENPNNNQEKNTQEARWVFSPSTTSL